MSRNRTDGVVPQNRPSDDLAHEAQFFDVPCLICGKSQVDTVASASDGVACPDKWPTG